MATWLRESKVGTQSQTTLTLHIQPGAKTTEVVGPHGDALKIRLAAPPVDGKANAALITFLADRLGVARSTIEVISGQTSRRKILAIRPAVLDIEELLSPTAGRQAAD